MQVPHAKFGLRMPAGQCLAAVRLAARRDCVDRAQGGDERVTLALWPDDGACWCRSRLGGGPWSAPIPGIGLRRYESLFRL